MSPTHNARYALGRRLARAAVLLISALLVSACNEVEFSQRERAILASLSLSALPPAQSISNRFADNSDAQRFGELLFHDPRLSRTGTVSCASCHQPSHAFTDARALATGIGATHRNTPTLRGTAWQNWFYWDGRRDSLWSQALAPIETELEMGNNRVAVAQFILTDANYSARYEQVFGAAHNTLRQAGLPAHAGPFGNARMKADWQRLPGAVRHDVNQLFANIGKAIAAYEHTLAPLPGRFDAFADAVANGASINDKLALSRREIAGARLFIDESKTQCLQCHNGPRFSNDDFHNTATLKRLDNPPPGTPLDTGRSLGAQAVLLNEFNCVGPYSDAEPEQCNHLIYMNRAQQMHVPGAFKTPGLRTVARTAPYFHDGRHASLDAVMQHYLNPPENIPHEIRQPPLNKREVADIIAFMQALQPATTQHLAAH